MVERILATLRKTEFLDPKNEFRVQQYIYTYNKSRNVNCTLNAVWAAGVSLLSPHSSKLILILSHSIKSISVLTPKKHYNIIHSCRCILNRMIFPLVIESRYLLYFFTHNVDNVFFSWFFRSTSKTTYGTILLAHTMN